MKKRLRAVGGVLLAVVLTMGLNIGSVFAQDDYTALDGNFEIPVKVTLDPKGSPTYSSHVVNCKVTEGKTYGQNPTITIPYNEINSINSISYVFDGNSPGGEVVTKEGESFNFSGVKFPKPGLYKFTITGSDSTIYVEPVSGSEIQYFLYVQVDNVNTGTGNSDLEYAPTAFKLVKGSKDSAPTESDKVTEALFENEFLHKTISIRKETTGNQGDKARQFNFSVQLGGVNPQITYNVNCVSGTPKVGTTAITATNPYNARGTNLSNIMLKDGDEVLITGIPKAAQITVQETEFNQDGYTSKSSVDDAAPTSANGYTVAVEDTADHSVVYINDKQGAIPTGIFINNWPYIAVALTALIAAAVIVRRRRNSYADEEL